ncbi:MAG TPA: VWA domain-containing protein [Candidatus Angelobacter sp.]|nr:VWA domain-containing protein [Candidatus Angelobacter sp.]
MFGRVHSERKSGNSEWLIRLALRKIISPKTAAVFVLMCLACGAARGQAAQTSVEAYADAVKQSVIAQRIPAMEHYLTLPGVSSLRVDALEFLIWDHLRLGHQPQALQHARELLAIEPANPLAVAVLNQEQSAARGKSAMQKRVAMLNSTLGTVDQLRRPEGMPQRNFELVRKQVAIMLKGAIGLSELDLEDYPAARASLQEAVDSDPNNVRWVYGLGLAMLNGKNKDEYRGYWYLARAANLSGPQGKAIADYAKRTYHSDGGTDAGWQAFVASAAVLDAPPNPAGSGQGSASSAIAANTNAGSGGNAGGNARAAGQPQPGTSASSEHAEPVTGASSKRVEDSGSAAKERAVGKSKSNEGFEATLRAPEHTTSPSRSPKRTRAIAAPTEAVSLGILIETSLLTNQNRATIISTLREIVRSLRVNDEACILVFSDQLDFEQDLTADDALLEEALGQIRPRPGKALLSGVAFAAGHLKRIGKNSNRVLLVISDGESKSDDADTLSFRSQVTGVRIDCIGLKTAGLSERTLLQRIAAYSGGEASFAAGPQEFRMAALEITRSMGIAVP